ncbi:MAG: hypothetical protein ACRDPS_21745 [Nocardioides sp.]|uniref:hypothetical protein n=1 Tax=Nocardioides sp. TaxID=35761 RepID=UPI003D6BE26E
MRAVQRAIVAIGMVLVAAVAFALLLGGPRSTGPDTADSPQQADTAQKPPAPDGPPEPVDAAKDTSVGTLRPSSDASLDGQMVSRDLIAPPEADGAQDSADRTPPKAPKARAEQPASGHLAAARERNGGTSQDGWRWEGREPEWGDWEDWADWAERNRPDGDRDRDREGDREGHDDYDWRD